ncbi:MAG: hypothetical protein ACI8QC_000563 [Planctomycetota bacterium]|jgi:hypothetical protein
MSEQQNATAIESLNKALDELQVQVSKFAESDRWRRGWDRSKEFCEEAQRGMDLMAQAIRLLKLDNEGEEEAKESWLSRRVISLAKALTPGSENGAQEGSEQRNEEFEVGVGFRGDCQVLELPDLISMVRNQGLTGRLLFTNEAESVHLHFRDGDLVHAHSENTPKGLRLGEVLVTQGRISSERLESVLFCHQDSPKMLGQILLEGKLVEPNDLEEAFVFQIQALFDRLFSYREGTSFRFLTGLTEQPETPARLNVLGLLLESARNRDERAIS